MYMLDYMVTGTGINLIIMNEFVVDFCFTDLFHELMLSSYLEAGRNVMILFQNKGWTTIITDSMVENVLTMTSVGIGLLTGLVGLIVATSSKNAFYAIGFENPQLVGFL